MKTLEKLKILGQEFLTSIRTSLEQKTFSKKKEKVWLSLKKYATVFNQNFSVKEKLSIAACLLAFFLIFSTLIDFFSYRRVDFYLKNLRTEKALQELKKKETFFKDSPEFKIRLAHTYIYQDRLKEAYQNLKTAYQQESNHSRIAKVAILLANSIRTSGKDQTANEILEYFCLEKKECQKYLLESYLLSVREYISEDRLKQAKEALSKIEELRYSESKTAQINLLKKDLASAYSTRTKKLIRLGKHEKAEETIKKALALHKSPLDLVVLADLIYRRTDKSEELEKAVVYYKRAYSKLNKDRTIFNKHKQAISKLENLLKKEEFAPENIKQILAKRAIED